MGPFNMYSKNQEQIQKMPNSPSKSVLESTLWRMFFPKNAPSMRNEKLENTTDFGDSNLNVQWTVL